MTTGTTMTASITHSIVNDGDGYFDHMGWHLWIWDAAGVMAFHSVFDTIAAAQAYATSAYGLTVADEFVEECGECEVAHDLLDLVSDGSAFPPPRMLAGAGAAAFDATVLAYGITNAPAGHASASAQAFDPKVWVQVSAGHAAASAAAYNATIPVPIEPGFPQSTAETGDPEATLRRAGFSAALVSGAPAGAVRSSGIGVAVSDDRPGSHARRS